MNITVHNGLEYILILEFLYDCGFTWKIKQPSYKTLSRIYGDMFAVRIEGSHIDVVLHNRSMLCIDSKKLLKNL